MTSRLAFSTLVTLLLVAPAAALAQTTTPGETGGTSDTTTTTTTTPTTTNTATSTTTSPPPTTSSSVAPMQPVTNEPGPSGSQPPAHWAPYQTAPRSDDRPNHLLYLEVTGGGHWLDMYAVSHSDNFLPPMTVHTQDIGFGFGAAVGIRPVAFFGIGARANLGFYPQYNFGIAAVEVDLRLPTKVVEPYLRVGFGYAWVGNANYNDPSMSGTTIYGFAVTSSIGLDIYLSESFSIGAAFDFDGLNLSRQPPNSDTIAHFASVDLSTAGNAVGLHIGGHAALALHFL